MSLRTSKKILGLCAALRHIPPRAVIARFRRKFRTFRLLSRPEMILASPLTVKERENILQALTARSFVSAARKQAEITASSFSYDPAQQSLRFLASGDIVSLADVEQVPWTTPGGVPESDVNRCYFMSFVEQATSISDDAGRHLDVLCRYVQALSNAAPLTANVLAICWTPLAAARRIINLCAGLSLLLKAQPTLAGSEHVSYLLEHVRVLSRVLNYLREDDLGYNHLATEVFAQFIYQSVFSDTKARTHALEEFVSVMEAQVGPDGMQRERSATYQAHMLGHVEVARAMAQGPELQGLNTLAERMRRALATVTHPNGTIAVFNDAAIGDGPSPEVLGAATENREGGLSILADAGYARLHAGELTAIFDAGQCGPDDNPGHAHADFLSFELSSSSGSVIVDPGVATYKAGTSRDWTRSSSVHNGPALVNAEPIEFIGAFRLGRRGRAYLFDPVDVPCPENSVSVSGWQNGYQHAGATVGRWLGMWPNALVGVDCWIASSSEYEAQSSFLVPARWCVASEDSNRVLLSLTEGGQAFEIVALSGELICDSSAIYYPFGPRAPQPAVRITLRPCEAGNYRTASFAMTFDGVNVGTLGAHQISREIGVWLKAQMLGLPSSPRR